jgi:hypothetical protein
MIGGQTHWRPVKLVDKSSTYPDLFVNYSRVEFSKFCTSKLVISKLLQDRWKIVHLKYPYFKCVVATMTEEQNHDPFQAAFLQPADEQHLAVLEDRHQAMERLEVLADAANQQQQRQRQDVRAFY